MPDLSIFIDLFRSFFDLFPPVVSWVISFTLILGLVFLVIKIVALIIEALPFI